MFGRSKDVPKQVSASGLTKWYSSLDDQNKAKLNRYLEKADTSSDVSFLGSVMGLALNDENYVFAAFIGSEGSKLKMKDLQRFMFNENLIHAYVESEQYDDAKRVCMESLSIYPKISSEFIKQNNGVPEKMNCRNRLIDVMVGVEKDYDGALEMLNRFYEMGLIDKDSLDLRTQSIKVHRMQRIFDGVYTYRPKE